MTAGALVKQSLTHGWNVFTRRPWFMIGSVLIIFVVSIISGAVAQSASESGSAGAALLFNALDFLVVQIIISMGLIAWSLRANENVDGIQFSTLWQPHPYWKFLGTSMVVTVIELIGFVLLIIPGIIASVFLLFAPYLVMDRGLSPIEAIKKSFVIVKDHFWGVFLLLFAVLAINIAGALVFGIGLFVSVPVSVVAIAHAYKTLAQMTPAAYQA